MKVFKKTLFAILLSASMLFATACGKTTNPPTQTATEQSYSFEQGRVVFERNKAFSLVGTTIRVVMSDGTIKTIILTDDMIVSMPDMSTVGQKTVKILYNQKEYTINFTVVENEHDKYSAVVADFLQKFKTENISSITGQYNIDFFSKFLENQFEFDDQNSFELTKEQTQNLFADPLMTAPKDLYDILLKSFVESSLTVENMPIINFEELAAQYGFDAFLSLLAKNVASANYQKYITESVLKPYRPQVQEALTELLAYLMDDLSEITVSNIANEMMYGIYIPLSYGEQVDIDQVLDRMIKAVKKDTQGDVDFYVMWFECLKGGEYNHLLSRLYAYNVYEEFEYEYAEEKVYYDPWGTEYNYFEYYSLPFDQETEEQTQARIEFFDTLIETLQMAEDLYQTTDLAASLQQIVDYLNTLSQMDNAMRDEWNMWLLGGLDYRLNIFNLIYPLQLAVYALEGDLVSLDNNLKVSNIVAAQMAAMLTEFYYNESYEKPYEQVNEELAQYLQQQLALLIEQRHDFDAATAIRNIKQILPNFHDVLVDNFEQYGTPKLLVWLINQSVDRHLANDDGSEDFAEYKERTIKERDALLPIANALDFLITYDGQKFVFNTEQIKNLQDAVYIAAEYFETYPEFSPITPLVQALTDTSVENFLDRILNAIDYYKQEVSTGLTYFVGMSFGMTYSQELEQQINTWAQGFVEELVNKTVELETSFADLFAIIDANASNAPKAVFYSTLALTTFFMEDVDYNTLFSNIQLPEQIKSIDFNVLVAQLKNHQTYDIFDLSKVEVCLLTDEQGNIVGEKLTLTLNTNFDILISQIIGEVELELTVNFA